MTKKYITEKNVIYHFKYYNITINDHNSYNSTLINIKFTFAVYEHIILYEYILLSM